MLLTYYAGFREVQVFVTPRGDVFSSPNAGHLPVVPDRSDIFLCDIHHPREASKVRWHSKLSQHLPYIACHPSYDNPIFKRLACTKRGVPITRDGGWYFLKQEIQDSWYRLERALLWVTNVLLTAGRVNLQLGWEPGPVPSACGYRNRHTEEVFARRCAMKSRDAFVPLMALCSWSISLVGVAESADKDPRWVSLLRRDNQSLQLSWIEDLTNSIIADFNIPRIGSFMDVTVDEDTMRIITPMFQSNVPIWFYWGTISHPIMSYDRKLEKYRPKKAQIEAANVKITATPAFMPAISRFSDPSPPPPPQSPAAPITVSLPKGTRQKPGETWMSYFDRRRERIRALEMEESSMQKQRRLARERHSKTGKAPGKKGATVFYWDKHESGFRIRRQVPRGDVAELWEEYAPSQRRYDGFSDEWDICSEFDPDAINPNDEDDEPYGTPDIQHASVDIPPGNVTMTPAAVLLAHPEHLNASDWNDTNPDYNPEVSSNITDSHSHDTIVDIAHYRYGLILSSTYTSSSSSLPDWNTTKRILGIESQVSAHPAVMGVIRELVGSLLEVAGGVVRYPPKGLWDLNLHDDEYLPKITSPTVSLRVENTSIGLVCWIESINLHSSRNAPWSLLVQDPAIAIECLRRRWGPHLVDIAFELHSRGIPFKTYIAVNYQITLDRPAVIGLGYRLSGYVPSKRDYETYESIRNRFLSSPRARAAMLKGGIIWRLAKEAIPESAVLSGPSTEVYSTGAMFQSNRGIFLDDGLSEDELDLISGVYKVFTGKFLQCINISMILIPGDRKGKGVQESHLSWWPKHSIWARSGLDMGYWSESSERWFLLRLESIRAGNATLRSGQEWNQAIGRLEPRSKKIVKANRDLVAKALERH